MVNEKKRKRRGLIWFLLGVDGILLWFCLWGPNGPWPCRACGFEPQPALLQASVVPAAPGTWPEYWEAEGPKEALKGAASEPVKSAGKGRWAGMVDGLKVYMDPMALTTQARVERYEVQEQLTEGALLIDRPKKIFPALILKHAPNETVSFNLFDKDFLPISKAVLSMGAGTETPLVWRGQDSRGKDVPAGRYVAQAVSAQHTVVKEVYLK